MSSQDDLSLEIQRRKHPKLGGIVIEYQLNIMNQGNADITLLEVTVNDSHLIPEANCLAPGGEIDCLICRTGAVQEREGKLPLDNRYEGKVIWLDYSGNKQISLVAYRLPIAEH